MKEKDDYERLKVVEANFDVDRKNLKTVFYIDYDIYVFVSSLGCNSELTADMKKYVIDKFRGELIEKGVDIENSVREINSVTELELWCQDAAVAINKAIRCGEADENEIIGIIGDFTDLDDVKKVKSNGYKETWMKNPEVKSEYKHIYDEDTWEKEDIVRIDEIHSKCYLHTALKIEEFLSKEDENAIGRALRDAGYDKKMTRWFVCKKILIYAMGVHNKSIGDIAKATGLSAEEIEML